jgi:hypothetical protein
VDQQPPYRHYPTMIRAIASGIIIIEVQNDHIISCQTTHALATPLPTLKPNTNHYQKKDL